MKHRILTLALFSTILLGSCGGGKAKDEKPADALAPTTDQPATTAAPAGADAELTQWLGGKTLHSTKADPKLDMYDNLKLAADGTCTDKDNAAAKWKVENGEFVLMTAMELKNKIDKKDDTTVVFHGAIGDDVYTLTANK